MSMAGEIAEEHYAEYERRIAVLERVVREAREQIKHLYGKTPLLERMDAVLRARGQTVIVDDPSEPHTPTAEDIVPFTLRMPLLLRNRLTALAVADGVSLNTWIVAKATQQTIPEI